MENLKIAIIGVGGVGGYIGGKLIQAGHDVTLIARGEHRKVLETTGLKVIDNKQEFTVRPNVIDVNDPEHLKATRFDVIFICSKSYDFQSVCSGIKACVDERTLIIPLANGVGHKAVLERYLERGIVCEGCIYIIAHLKEYGVVVKKADTFYLIFGSDREDERLHTLLSRLNESGLKTKLSQKVTYDCWKKYLFIASFASLTSYFKQPMGYVAKEQKELLKALLDEIRSVANALQVPISDEDIQKTIRQGENVPYDSKTSMQIDFEKGHKTEIESLCGYIVREGMRLGMDVEEMERMYNTLKGKDQTASNSY
jgi:2-dehydropantoate 2-reductase